MKKLLPVLLAISLGLSTSHEAEALRVNFSIDKGRLMTGIISLCSAAGIHSLYDQYVDLLYDYVKAKEPDCIDMVGVTPIKLKALCGLGILASSLSGVYQLYKSIQITIPSPHSGACCIRNDGTYEEQRHEHSAEQTEELQ